MSDTSIIATLHIASPGVPQSRHFLKRGNTATVGREQSCTIMLDDPSVSREHATFTASESGVLLSDMGSLNGTFVNSERVLSMRDLGPGDVVDIGATKITVEVHSAEAAANLSSSGGTRAMTAQLRPIAVSVLVATVPNYSSLTEHAPVSAVAQTHFRWNQEVAQLVQRASGSIDKIVGATIVALWTGRDAPALAYAAFEAGQGIRDLTERIASRAEWMELSPSHRWRSTVVLSSGHGLQGVVGAGPVGGKNDFTVLGDPTNLAFRLEELVGKLGQDFIVAGPTAELIRARVRLQRVVKVRIAGEDDEMEVFSPQEDAPS